MRKLDNGSENMKLEAKIKTSTEYPLRLPRFELSIHSSSQGENYSKINDSKWSNKLRTMEAEVNVHIIKMIPFNQENSVLAHQVLCLAMEFDFFLDREHTSPEKRTCTSVIDVGLCKPMIGGFISRSFRGRDRKKMISRKDHICTPSYPY